MGLDSSYQIERLSQYWRQRVRLFRTVLIVAAALILLGVIHCEDDTDSQGPNRELVDPDEGSVVPDGVLGASEIAPE